MYAFMIAGENYAGQKITWAFDRGLSLNFCREV